MGLRLHSRLVGLNAAALLVMALLLGVFFDSTVKKTFESEIESQFLNSATLAETFLRDHRADRNDSDLAAELAKLLQVRITLIAPDGRVLGDSDVTQSGLAALENHSDRPEFIEARGAGRGTSIRQSATIGIPFIYVARTLDDGTVLRLAMPLDALEMLMSDLRRQLALAVLVGLGLTLMFGYTVYAVVSRPLKKLADASRQLALGDLNGHIPTSGDRDLAKVGSSLNAMARALRDKMAEMEADQHRTEAIITAMSAGVVVFDREAKVFLANRTIQTLLDLQVDATGKGPMELVRNPSLENVVRTALTGSDAPAIEVTTRHGRVLLANAAPIRALSGDVELVVTVFHDLTDIKRTERMRKDFVANVSHEFKTPLTSIRGFAEILRTEEPADPAVKHEFFEAIERNSVVLQALVDDLLVLSQLEREIPIESERVNLCELIEQQLKAKQPLLSAKNIQVKTDCSDLEIQADPARLTRAISNLIDNAVHYNRAEGQIRIAASKTDRGVRIDIEDTGVGIPPEDLHRIFERFYRVEKSRTKDLGGTGLGLAIVKHAIESQNGTISVSSKVGAGSTFTIWLPVA